MTGIAPNVWAEHDDRAIVTALHVLDERSKKQRSNPSRSGQQLSG